MGSFRLPILSFLSRDPIPGPLSCVLGIFPAVSSSMSHLSTLIAFLAAGKLSPFKQAINTPVPALAAVVAVPTKSTWLHQSQRGLAFTPSCAGILSQQLPHITDRLK